MCPRDPPQSPPRGPRHGRVRAPRLCVMLAVPMETQKIAEKVTSEVGGFSGRALCPLSDPGPAARPVGSCSPKAAAALCAEDAGRRLSPPPPNLLERGGGHWGGAVRSVIGQGRLQPPSTSPPPIAAWNS